MNATRLNPALPTMGIVAPSLVRRASAVFFRDLLGGHHEDRDARRLGHRLQRLDDFEAAHVRHHQVEQDQLGVELLRQRRWPRGRRTPRVIE
jgi:hypothetical protein